MVTFKIKMRETATLPDLDWDNPLLEEMQKDWKAAKVACGAGGGWV